MTPENFLEGLLVHFGKRHADDRAEQIWTRDMLGAIRGTDPRVLAKAYTLIVSEHDERAFPLPAILRRYIERACESVYPERPGTSERVIDLAPPTPEARERVRKLRELVVATLRAQHVQSAPAELPDVSRKRFEAMIRASPNQHLYVDQSLAKRITGERE